MAYQMKRSLTQAVATTTELTENGQWAITRVDSKNRVFARMDGVVYEVCGDNFALLASPTFTGTPAAPTATSGTNTTQIATTAFVKSAVDAALAGLDFQADVLNVQTDNTLDPGATPTAGDRYIVTDVAQLHANFGTITGVGNNDIVEYDGSAFVISYDVSAKGEGAIVWNRNSDTFKYFATTWSDFGGLTGVTAGDGLSKTGNTIDIEAGGVTNTMLAGSIADTKLNQLTTANKVAGSAVQLASSGGVEDSTGLKIKVDATTGATVAPITLNANGAGLTVDNATIKHTAGSLYVAGYDDGTF